MNDGLLSRLETAEDERNYYKARLAEADALLRDIRPDSYNPDHMRRIDAHLSRKEPK